MVKILLSPNFILLLITALLGIIFILSILLQNSIAKLKKIDNILILHNNIKNNAHRSPDYSSLTPTQKIIYLTAFERGYKFLLNKIKNDLN